MDELEMIRELFAEPEPPRPAVVSSARARLTGKYAPGLSRPRFRVSIAAPVAAAAVVTAVAVVLASLPHGPAAPAGQAGGASSAASDPAAAPSSPVTLASGRYWVQAGVVGNYLRVGQPGHRYVMLEKVAVQSWWAQSVKLTSPSLSQPLSVTPATAADQEAWRAAGAPAVWASVGQDTTLANPQGFTGGFSYPLKAGAGKLVAGAVGYGIGGFFVFGRPYSARQLLALPASPAALKQRLIKQEKSDKWDGSFASYLSSTLPGLMTLPVSAAVRHALYQVLASQPGVRDLGQVSDVAGQRGTGLAVTGHWSGCGNEIAITKAGSGPAPTFASCAVQQILIVNPATWIPVAEELRYTALPPGQSWSPLGGMFSYELFKAGYWTNANPPGK